MRLLPTQPTRSPRQCRPSSMPPPYTLSLSWQPRPRWSTMAAARRKCGGMRWYAFYEEYECVCVFYCVFYGWYECMFIRAFYGGYECMCVCEREQVFNLSVVTVAGGGVRWMCPLLHVSILRYLVSKPIPQPSEGDLPGVSRSGPYPLHGGRRQPRVLMKISPHPVFEPCLSLLGRWKYWPQNHSDCVWDSYTFVDFLCCLYISLPLRHLFLWLCIFISLSVTLCMSSVIIWIEIQEVFLVYTNAQ